MSSEPQAQKVVERLNNGEDFAALAREMSTDPTANQGGYMGKLDPAKLRPELQEALRGIGQGQRSAIARMPAGYAVLKVLANAPNLNPQDAQPNRLQALMGAGAVRPTLGPSGFTEALLAVGRFPKPDGWNHDLHQACEVRRQAVGAALNQSEAYLARPALETSIVFYLNSVLALLHSYRGDMGEAIGYWEPAYRLALAKLPEQAAQLEESLGVSYLHRAGTRLYETFVFPVPVNPRTVNRQQKADLEKAADYFGRCLKRQPDNMEVRWLLNLTHMLSGTYPGAVPKEYLIPPAVLDSQEDIGRFLDVAPAAGLDNSGGAGGAIADDFDNDGLLDVVVSGLDDCEPLRFFHNNGNGTFTNRAAQAKLTSLTGGLNIIQTDYNNDGCKDILVLRGGWEYARPKSLLRNNCDGTFTDVTLESGIKEPVTSTQTAVWADIDNDGKLDLFVGNESAPAQLFLNKGDGTFVDIAHSAGVDRTTFAKAVVAADYDNDGYVDLYVSAFKGQHFLYHNNHDRTFTEVSRQAGVEGPSATFGSWFFDYDNDGWQDLFVAGYSLSVDDVMRGYLRLPQRGESLRLYRNLGNGTFRDVTAEVGLDRAFMPMGLNFGDLDNDGFLDFYLGSGNPAYASAIPNVLFHNQDGKRFVDVTASSGTGILPKGHGVVFADLDNDGDEDMFVVMGGAVPGDRHTARLFENPAHGNDWINVHLVGLKSNRAGIGAQIKVTVENEGHGTRSIYRRVGSGGSFGASPLDQHIGLGRSARIANLEIWWPASNTRQSFSGVGKNQFIQIREFEKDFKKVERRSFRLGGARK